MNRRKFLSWVLAAVVAVVPVIAAGQASKAETDTDRGALRFGEKLLR